MCQYLYASFSLKAGPEDGLTAEQAAAVARWRDLLTGIAVEEMLHLALVFNVMTAIGAAPPLSRPNFPRGSDDLPGGVQFRLLPFGTDSLTHFLYLERPEGMERRTRRGSCRRSRRASGSSRVRPSAARRTSARSAISTAASSRAWLPCPAGSASAACSSARGGPRPRPSCSAGRSSSRCTTWRPRRPPINEIVEQGEGARGDWRPAHYGRFLGIWEEYAKLTEASPAFEPAFPVIPAFTRQPYDVTEPQPLLTDPLTRAVAEVFNLGYELLLQALDRFFTHTDETDEQLQTLVSTAFGLMADVLRPLGRALPRLPAWPGHPGRTAGPTFEMYYQFGNFVPWREPAWALLSERAAILATRSADAAALPGAPAAVNDAATAAAGLAAQLLAHVPEELRHVR